MDIYDFIRSPDIAEHCRKIGKTWNTCEMAVLIGRSDKSIEDKHAAWQELIRACPDMPAMPNIHRVTFDSIHTKLEEIMAFERLARALFAKPEHNAVWIMYNSARFEHGVYSTCEKAMDAAAKGAEDTDGYQVSKRFIDREESGGIDVSFDRKGNITDLEARVDDALRAHWFPGVVSCYESSHSHLVDTFFIDIPTPFQRGDILTQRSDRMASDGAFVLDTFSFRNEAQKQRALRGEICDGSDIIGWGYFVSDAGVLYSDHVHGYDNCVYYEGKLEDCARLLHYVSLHLQNQEAVDLAALLNVQCKIIAEHQLEHNHLTNAHGVYIAEEHLAENRLASVKQASAPPADG